MNHKISIMGNGILIETITGDTVKLTVLSHKEDVNNVNILVEGPVKIQDTIESVEISSHFNIKIEPLQYNLINLDLHRDISRSDGGKNTSTKIKKRFNEIRFPKTK